MRTPTQALNFVKATLALQRITNEYRLERTARIPGEAGAASHELEVLRQKTKLASIQTHVLCTSVERMPATAGVVQSAGAADSEILVYPTLRPDFSPTAFPAGTKAALQRTDESGGTTAAAHPLDGKCDEPIVLTFPADSYPGGGPHVVLATAWCNGSIRSLQRASHWPRPLAIRGVSPHSHI